MGKFTGSTCMVCQKPFTDEDDIVVCPDCGTPYHRDCWMETGKCINTTLHAVGGSWASIQQEQRLKRGGIVCPHCQHINLPDAQFCESCNGTLSSGSEEPEEEPVRIPLPGSNLYFDLRDPCCGLPPEEKIEDETLGDVANYVKTNTLYYLPLFRRFRDTGRKISLNLTCVLFPHLYFAYRKMWSMAIVSALILLVCSLPATLSGMLTTLTTPEFMQKMTELYGSETVSMFDGLTAFLQAHQTLLENLNVPLYLLSIAARLGFCLFGNYLYFRFVLRKIGRIRHAAPNEQVKRSLIVAEGGTSIWNILGCCGLYYGALFALYMILMLVFL